MGFPYIFESNFEGGTAAEWTTGETDTDGILDFPHYRTLAAYGLEPYSGAYCMRIVAPGATPADAYVSAPECNIADTATNYFRFNLLFSKDFTCTATDAAVALLELQGAGNNETVAFGFSITITTDVILLGIGAAANNAVPGTFSTEPIERGVWYTVELAVNIETDASGTVDMYVSRKGGPGAVTAEAAIDTITNIAVTHAVLGIQDQLATTSGTILIDNFVQDEARLYHHERYPETMCLTKTGHAFVGPGKIDALTLLPGSAAGSVLVYDSDAVSTANLVAELSTVANETATRVSPINVARGAYCVFTGQGEPRAYVKIGYASHSAAAVRDVGMRPS